jgi:hypothetical protein
MDGSGDHGGEGTGVAGDLISSSDRVAGRSASYSAEHPRRYRALFDFPEVRTRQRPVDQASMAEGLTALNVLVEGIADCARAGRPASKDHFADAVAVWVALHGLATLLAGSAPAFPWPDHDQLVTAIVSRLAQLDAAPAV